MQRKGNISTTQVWNVLYQSVNKHTLGGMADWYSWEEAITMQVSIVTLLNGMLVHCRLAQHN